MEEKLFFSTLESTKEGLEYLNLVSLAKARNLSLEWERGFERHHIHPRGLGGSLEEYNVVKLTVFEHCLAHIYLAKAIPCSQTLKPIVKLSGRQYLSLSDLEKVTLEEIHKWSELREKALHIPRSEEFKKKLSLLLRGRPKTVRENFGKSRIGKIFINNGVVEKFIYPDELETFEKKGWIRGRKPRSKEWGRKHGDALRGIRLSEEHKRHIGAGLSLAKRGKVCICKNSEIRYVDPENLQKYLDQGYIRGRKSPIQS